MSDLLNRRGMKLLQIVLTFFWSSVVYAVTPANWKDTGFSINANGMKFSEVMQEFGKAYGVQIKSSIKASIVVKGRLKADNGSDFLERLTQVHDFRWFVYNGTLYLVPRHDNVSARLEVGEDAVQDAKAALVGVGLFDGRFGWGELPDEGVVLVNGPQEYVNLVRGILAPEHKKSTPKGKQIMVFRLTYASASDRVITTRGQKETIPGIKSILNSLLNQGATDRFAETRSKFDVGSEKRSRSEKNGRPDARENELNSRHPGTGRTEDADNSEQSRSGKAKSGLSEDKPRIDADTSINAIIVYDYANKREMYKNLIAELDIEPQQIEIEALIVDIDRNKLSELGVEWTITGGSQSSSLPIPVPGSALMISNLAHFYAKLKALESSGEARVLAKPTVLTLDNVAAVLDLSQSSYVPLVGERVAELANITAGTMLRVVPRVLRDANRTRVRLEVDIEDGALGDPSAKSNVTRSTISTQAIIDTQQTLMIGGYHSESTTNGVRKLPVLGDVPLFGPLFRTHSESRSERERLFLITPRLSGTNNYVMPQQFSEVKPAELPSRNQQTVVDKLPTQSAKLVETRSTHAAPVTIVPATTLSSAAVEKLVLTKVPDVSLELPQIAQVFEVRPQSTMRKRQCAKSKSEQAGLAADWLLFHPKVTQSAWSHLR